MKANTNLSEAYNDSLSRKKGVILLHVNKSFLILLLGVLFMSAMTIPVYMSLQTVMEVLEPAASEHLESLITDVHPAAYLTHGKITTTGEEASRIAICDAASVNLLYKNNPALSSVELIKFTPGSTNDLPTSIDLPKLEELKSLKYLLVEFEYDPCVEKTNNCFSSILTSIIQGNSTQITVIYNHSIPE